MCLLSRERERETRLFTIEKTKFEVARGDTIGENINFFLSNDIFTDAQCVRYTNVYVSRSIVEEKNHFACFFFSLTPLRG